MPTSMTRALNNQTLSHQDFYRQLTSRNIHFINPFLQKKLKEFRILIAGCGSTGGACIEPLARVGVENFILADNGEFEISNLNRQHARLSAIGVNKASFHQSELLEINPFIKVEVDTRGINLQNAEKFCQKVDLVFDAVDVTTAEGMSAKLQLHESAKKCNLPVLSALDLGFHQFGMSFDYRNPKLLALNGKLAAAKNCQHPIKALFSIYPVASIPDHCLPLILDLARGTCSFASQLGCTSDLLGAIIVPVLLRYLNSGQLVEGWSYNTELIATGQAWSLKRKISAWQQRLELVRLLEKLE